MYVDTAMEKLKNNWEILSKFIEMGLKIAKLENPVLHFACQAFGMIKYRCLSECVSL